MKQIDLKLPAHIVKSEDSVIIRQGHRSDVTSLAFIWILFLGLPWLCLLEASWTLRGVLLMEVWTLASATVITFVAWPTFGHILRVTPREIELTRFGKRVGFVAVTDVEEIYETYDQVDLKDSAGTALLSLPKRAVIRRFETDLLLIAALAESKPWLKTEYVHRKGTFGGAITQMVGGLGLGVGSFWLALNQLSGHSASNFVSALVRDRPTGTILFGLVATTFGLVKGADVIGHWSARKGPTVETHFPGSRTDPLVQYVRLLSGWEVGSPRSFVYSPRAKSLNVRTMRLQSYGAVGLIGLFFLICFVGILTDKNPNPRNAMNLSIVGGVMAIIVIFFFALSTLAVQGFAELAEGLQDEITIDPAGVHVNGVEVAEYEWPRVTRDRYDVKTQIGLTQVKLRVEGVTRIYDLRAMVPVLPESEP